VSIFWQQWLEILIFFEEDDLCVHDAFSPSALPFSHLHLFHAAPRGADDASGIARCTAFKTGMMRTFVVINRVVGFIHARHNY
jgi:hypothetical protein